MRFLQSILWGTDFGPASLDVEEAVTRLAVETGAGVTLLHVVNPLQFWPTQLPDLSNEADDLLKSVADRLTSAGVKVSGVLVAKGQQSDTIIRKAREINAELIVIGAGEYNEEGRFLTGPLAEAIIQNSEKPVLAVRPGDPPVSFKNILCPVDHSVSAKQGLLNAIALAHVCKSQLTVLSVVPEVSWLASTFETGRIVGAIEEHDHKWHEEFEKFLSDIDFADLSWQKEIRKGIPYQEIIRGVQEDQSDLIVMGCTGRSGLAQLLMGSTTRQLLRHMPCSILTLKEEMFLEDIFDEDIHTINLLFAEGQELVNAKAYERAREKFQQLLKRNPYHVRALERYADACAKLRYKQEAELYRHRATVLRAYNW